MAGFASGEGSFQVKIKTSGTNSLGISVHLEFQVTQATRDEKLIKSLIHYLGCGRLESPKNGVAVNFVVSKFEDITYKIIPFFNKYPVIGVKALDFSDWCKVAEMRERKQHLTSEGLDKIRQIKAGMNRGRINSTDLPSSKRLMFTTRSVNSEEVKLDIADLASVVIKPYLDNTHLEKGCKGKVRPGIGVFGSKVNSALPPLGRGGSSVNIYGSRGAKKGRRAIQRYVLNCLRVYIISASKLGKRESLELNTASLRHPSFYIISQICFIVPRNQIASGVRAYSSFNNSKDYPCIKVYPDMESAKSLILEENKDKCGVYLLTNRLTGKIYVGSSKNLAKRFKNYFSTGYLKHISRNMMIINKALLKYGYSKFKLEILEYTTPDKVFEIEQHFLDLLEPKYNMLKYAGTWLGYKHSEASKLAMSVDRKGENNPM